MAKGHIRSIRFKDDIADMIDRQAGETFTEKFERLVTRAYFELPAKEARLKEINQQIEDQRLKLKQLVQVYRKLSLAAEDIEKTIEGICEELEKTEL